MSEKEQKGWEEMDAGGFIKFEEPGHEVIGLLLDHEVKKTSKGDANEYKIVTPEGFKTFYAPKGLHDKLAGVIIKYGKQSAIVKIKYIEKVKTASGNDFKVFEVMHRQKTEKDLKEFGIDEGHADPSSF